MKTKDMPGLRSRFARGVRRPLHQRLVSAIRQCITWELPMKKEPTCKTEGHKFNLQNWNGPRNCCEECGAWIKTHEMVRPAEVVVNNPHPRF